jgi:hypothetical protein
MKKLNFLKLALAITFTSVTFQVVAKNDIKIIPNDKIGAANCSVSLKMSNPSEDLEKVDNEKLQELVQNELKKKSYILSEDSNATFKLEIEAMQYIAQDNPKSKRKAICKLSKAYFSIPSSKVLLQDASTLSELKIPKKRSDAEGLERACSKAIKKALWGMVECRTLKGYNF